MYVQYLFGETVDGVHQELRQPGHEAGDHRQANESRAQPQVGPVLVQVGEEVGVSLELRFVREQGKTAKRHPSCRTPGVSLLTGRLEEKHVVHEHSRACTRTPFATLYNRVQRALGPPHVFSKVVGAPKRKDEQENRKHR